MKKLFLLVFILFACNIIPPEPSDFTIEEVSIVGGPVHSVRDSVGLKLMVRGLPPTNAWKMVWEVNGQDVFTQVVAGQAGNRSEIKKFKGSQTGQYLYKGCIVSNTRRICGEATFFLQ
ncbi:hypothetical protein [Algoriphagus mannitolivorans]|uniref:hypothetical protein n=1 Tax=Algoriphagus mannitolivorans TaxID=226504 RepID=UPI0004245FE6|nr:hypothetical protein [Algoriphagus mannitolivorans]